MSDDPKLKLFRDLLAKHGGDVKLNARQQAVADRIAQILKPCSSEQRLRVLLDVLDFLENQEGTRQ